MHADSLGCRDMIITKVILAMPHELILKRASRNTQDRSPHEHRPSLPPCSAPRPSPPIWKRSLLTRNVQRPPSFVSFYCAGRSKSSTALSFRNVSKRSATRCLVAQEELLVPTKSGSFNPVPSNLIVARLPMARVGKGTPKRVRSLLQRCKQAKPLSRVSSTTHAC